MHLLLKNYGSSEPKPSATVTEIPEGEEAETQALTEENAGATSEIIPLATRTKEGMAALVKVLQGLPGEAAGSCIIHTVRRCAASSRNPPPFNSVCLMLLSVSAYACQTQNVLSWLYLCVLPVTCAL